MRHFVVCVCAQWIENRILQADNTQLRAALLAQLPTPAPPATLPPPLNLAAPAARLQQRGNYNAGLQEPPHAPASAAGGAQNQVDAHSRRGGVSSLAELWAIDLLSGCT
jgi:hypothetical protein